MTINQAKKEGKFDPNFIITRRVLRRYAKNYFEQWKKKNKVPGSNFKGMSLDEKINAIGGIK